MLEVPQVEAAMAAWRSALGAGAVDADESTLLRYARSTQPQGTKPCCVLRPATVDALRGLLRVAAAHRVPVYPISCGKNWGYGDACAPADGMAIVDLSGMNRILEVNAELGYAVIEPGVTQQQLCDHVGREAPEYWVDCTGAGPDASVLGNALERGFGHTPYGDHVRCSCGMEVMLADGRLLQTGFGHYPGARAAHVYPYGVGPALDGLFTQSNLGIVTKLGVWLYPAPEAFRFFFIKVEREDALESLIDALRPLRMRGVLNSAVHIGNDLRIISSLRRYPWTEAKGVTPLPEALRAALSREAGVGAWNVSGTLAGTRGQVRAAARALRRAAGGLGRLVFVDDRKLAWGKRVAGLLRKFGGGKVLTRQLEALEPNYGLLKGIPTNEPLRGAQWRVRDDGAGLVDPLDTHCGLLWISPVLPVRGTDARDLLTVTAPHFAEHGFDLLVTFTLLNERSMVAILNVAFDQRRAEEGVAARACYDATMTALEQHGFVPYRLGPTGMAHWTRPEDPFWSAALQIKAALDPLGILAPGRYIPAAGSSAKGPDCAKSGSLSA